MSVDTDLRIHSSFTFINAISTCQGLFTVEGDLFSRARRMRRQPSTYRGKVHSGPAGTIRAILGVAMGPTANSGSGTTWFEGRHSLYTVVSLPLG